MINFLRWLNLALLSLFVLSCSQRETIENNNPNDDDAFAREIISELADGKYTELIKKLDASVNPDVAKSILLPVNQQLPQGVPAVVKMKGINNRIFNLRKSSDLVYIYSVGRNSSIITVSLTHSNGKPQLMRLNVQALQTQ
jgi:hypothetical protein